MQNNKINYSSLLETREKYSYAFQDLWLPMQYSKRYASWARQVTNAILHFVGDQLPSGLSSLERTFEWNELLTPTIVHAMMFIFRDDNKAMKRFGDDEEMVMLNQHPDCVDVDFFMIREAAFLLMGEKRAEEYFVQKAENDERVYVRYHPTVVKQYDIDQEEESDSEDLAESLEVLPLLEPFQSECHKTALKTGELLVGGMPKKHPPKKRVTKRKAPARDHIVMYNSIPSMPDEFATVLKTFGLIAPTGATASIVLQVFSNSLLHSADDFTASAQSAFLANVGRNYTKYRVSSVTAVAVLSSRSTTDSNVSVLHSPVSLGYSSAASFLPESATRDKSSYHLVPANTKSPCIIGHKSSHKMLAIIGNPEYQQDKEYAGTLSSTGVPTDPTDLTYLTFYMGLTSGGSYTASTCPQISLTLTQQVKFYDKRV